MVKSLILTFLRGMCMGVADLIPGISGGTVAYMMGFWEKLIVSLSQFNKKFFYDLLKGKFQKAAKQIDFFFLLPLLLGIVTALFTGASVIHSLLSNSEIRDTFFSFFSGVVIASATLCFFGIKPLKISSCVFLFIGIGVVMLFNTFHITHETLQDQSGNWFELKLIVYGMLCSCAMLLPGISGSFLLVVFGVYERAIQAVSVFMRHGLHGYFHLDSFLFILQLGLGIIFGMFVFSRLIRWLFAIYRNQMIGFLVGMMFGGINTLVPAESIMRSFSSLTCTKEMGALFAGIFFLSMIHFIGSRKSSTNSNCVKNLS